MPGRPLLVTGDPALLDDLLRLAAAAGVEGQVAPDIAAARPMWSSAPLVLVGSDVAGSLSMSSAARRPGVLLVLTAADDEAAAFELAPAAGVESVLTLPRAERLLVERLTALAAGLAPAGRLIGVVPGRGGAGASTLAVALARTATRGSPGPTMLVDADPLGGGLDLALGAEHVSGLRWPDLAGTRGAASPDDLRAALPSVDGVTLLSWHRGAPVDVPGDAIEAVLTAAQRGHALVVVDLPRHPDPTAAAAAAVRAADTVLLVVPAEVRSAAAGAALATRLMAVTTDVRVVVRGPAPMGLTAAQVAETIGLPLAGWLAPEPGLAQALERGDPPPRSGRGPLARLCRDLLDDLAPPLQPAA